jgi:hypothetical protein
MSTKYTIIHNPLAIVFKHEVWYAGEQAVHDSDGFALGTRAVCKPVKSFRTAEKAEGFIRYQQEIAAFKGAAA